MRAMIVFLGLLAVAGCTATPRIAASNPVMIVLDNADDPALSLAAADTHCQQFGRHAQYRGKMPGSFGIRVAYDCVQ